MTKKRAIVIGAGILGLATARALALKGYAVTVFERNLKALGASVRNFGMVWPIGQPSGKLYERATRSRNCWIEIGNAAGLWYDRVGSLHVAHHPDEWVVLQELFDVFTREGRNVQLLSGEQVAKISSIARRDNCFGALFSGEEVIVDPREAIAAIPSYLEEHLGVRFNWGQTVTEVVSGQIVAAGQKFQADQIFICSGADFETLYPEIFSKFALTKCKLQMMRMVEEGSPRIGPAICGGLSLIHYSSFKVAPSLSRLKELYEHVLAEFLQWGIHVMVSQNRSGQLTVGDSHEYGMAPDPFDRRHINDLIIKYLGEFTTLNNPRIIETWNGVYGKFTDGQTELFYSPDKDVYILNGVGGAGMTLSFGFAEERVNAL